MRKLIYDVAASFDNFIAHSDGSIDGFLTEGEFVADFLERIQSYGAVLMGRKTYEWGYAFGLQKGQPAYTQVNPDLKNYIFSTSVTFEPGDLIDVVSDNEIDFVQQLKAEDGKPIWLCGGGELAGKLLDAQLIDELTVKLNPVVLGDGIRLFGSSQTKVNLHLIDSKPYDNGLILVKYQLTY
ncbi:dihydrofolate reductase family protein [Spirosoma validum]|uniref:Dihydrofolate reductase n=1 Tax=Spirosoma validum TaxID=2771355 RepID=A0A927B7F6_9BACT|nr:dihydrofolate reductase family protein [Spirosoma validum]MBD2756663.1 dihydrofolate reductase [Spirosoma validum]